MLRYHTVAPAECIEPFRHCRVKWVLSRGWRLNVMAPSPGTGVFYPLMFALIRCSARSAPLRNSLVSALLNYAFSWLEYGKRVCATSGRLHSTKRMQCRARCTINDHVDALVFSFWCIFYFLKENITKSMFVFALVRKENIKWETMSHEQRINNTDEWHVMRINIHMNVIAWALRAATTA